MTEDAPPEADRATGAPHPRETAALIGQAAAERQVLTALAEGRMHHAWLLTGPEGVGKATLAWRMARHLLATPEDAGGGLFGDAPAAPESLDIDPEHPVARRVRALSEPRLFLLRRAWDEKAKRLRKQIVIDDVRRLKSFFALSAAEGGRRVAIVDAADDLTVEAANALLKVLEEPPASAVLLLVSHRPARLLPTIRSRCRTVRLDPLAPEDVTAVVSAAGLSPDQPTRLAALSGGSAGEAIRLDTLGGVALWADLVRLFDTLPRLDRARAMDLIEPLAARGAEDRLALFVRLTDALIARLARHGAGAPPAPEAADGEHALLARLSPDARAALAWAALQAEVSGRTGHALAVNIDPAQAMLDMLLRAEDTARKTVPA